MVKQRFLNKPWVKPKFQHNKMTDCGWLVDYPKNLILDDYVDISTFVYINACEGVVIETEVEIGAHCAIYSVSTIDSKKGKVILKKNCKIGTHSTIMPGVTVGENSIVAAHSFVNENIPANEVWAGVPARFLMTLKEYKKKNKSREN